VKIAVITSQYPVAGDPGRGRPILQTVEALGALAQVEVFVPNARYPRWLAPRSYRYLEPHAGPDCSRTVLAHHSSYMTLPVVGRISNGHAVAAAVLDGVRRFAPDLLLSYWLYPDAYGAAQVANKLHVPLVSGARGSDLRARDRLSLLLTARALRDSAALLTVSEDLRRIAIERHRMDARRVATIPNGCDTTIFHPGNQQDARTALGLPHDIRLLLYVGRLVPAKGLRELLAAWQRLAVSDGALHLAMVGDGSLREELLARARSAGLAPRVHLPGGADAGRVATWMRAANVFCLPSYTEGYPNVLVEALACGRPLVTCPVGGVVEIADASNSEMVPPREAESLAAALHRALQRPWDEAALSRRFRRSWADVAAETLACCEAVLRRERSASEHPLQV
jgi:teichuronic acid biosynthesis glycosyltransferase TuaC